jgi:hypothetical protein
MDRALEAAAAPEHDPADDETRVIAASPAEERPTGPRPGGYVPPPVPNRPPHVPSRRPAPARSRALPWNAIGTLLILGAAALVVVLVVLPLLDLGATGGPAPSASAAAPSAAPTVRPDVVPDTVGLPTAEAIDLATAAGLDWTVRCQQDPQQPEGIIDQEPPAGTEVAPGSQFTMFSARIQDCR